MTFTLPFIQQHFDLWFYIRGRNLCSTAGNYYEIFTVVSATNTLLFKCDRYSFPLTLGGFLKINKYLFALMSIPMKDLFIEIQLHQNGVPNRNVVTGMEI
ncbi:neuronal acetylcholine receptor subunit beta-2 [Platysternon megacephalum]|uniref:Neuronal acetylcholine receptor subunit beta-2 n=1 Tax=Platysternon megacephalum TaxID=55544 RepID=A0A4D9DQ31_9SAUR|nr:neuronal acetylcholine receptor subunit beta-2 [Platysternon megacephalum]